MKILMANNEFISLEGVTRVSKRTNGTGSKASPFTYHLSIEYNHDEHECISCTSAQQMDAFFTETYNILKDSEKPVDKKD